MNPQQEIRMLKRQLRQEKKTNDRLRKRLESSTAKAAELPHAFADRVSQMEVLGKDNYFSYLYSLLRGTRLYSVWEKGVNYFRRFRLFSFLFRIVSYLILIVRFGTAFFFASLMLLILLPVTLLGSLGIMFSTITLYRRENRRMEKRLDGKKIFVFFPTREGEFGQGEFWRGNLADIAVRDNAVVLIVSPFFWSGRGLCQGKFYLLARKEAENIYILRRHYYFSLRRCLFDNKEGNIAFVY